MAGNEVPHEPSGEGTLHQQSTHKVKTFSCSHCGASVSLRNSKSLSVVCDSCKAIIDTSDENYRILQTFRGSVDLFTPRIELGSRAELFGKKWEMIGFIARADEASNFNWEEYLLFNPYEGYRWLTLADHHWNFVTPIKEKPSTNGLRARYKNKDYKIFDRGKACNLFVLGEFYWKVQIAEFPAVQYPIEMEDYIRPPEMLSREVDSNEINWSLATYVEASVIESAFKLQANDKLFQFGMAPNKPAKSNEMFQKMFKWWMLFIVLLTATQIIHMVTCANHLVVLNSYSFLPNRKSPASTTTPVFELGKSQAATTATTSATTATSTTTATTATPAATATSATPVFNISKSQANVSIKVGADVDNSWFYLSGELVNNDTGVSYPFERTVEYYHGYDSDGSWSEGGNSSQILIPSVPAGKYYINFDYESGGFTVTYLPRSLPYGRELGLRREPVSMNFTVSVWRDVSTYTDYFLCLLIVSILPSIYWIMKTSDENRRWAKSDFKP